MTKGFLANDSPSGKSSNPKINLYFLQQEVKYCAAAVSALPLLLELERVSLKQGAEDMSTLLTKVIELARSSNGVGSQVLSIRCQDTRLNSEPGTWKHSLSSVLISWNFSLLK